MYTFVCKNDEAMRKRDSLCTPLSAKTMKLCCGRIVLRCLIFIPFALKEKSSVLLVSVHLALPVLPLFVDFVAIDSDHWRSQIFADLRQHFGVLVVCDGLDHGTRPLLGVVALENARPDETAVNAQLHQQTAISRRCQSSGGKVDDGQTTEFGGLPEQIDGNLEMFGVGEELGLVHGLSHPDLPADHPGVVHGVDDVAGSGLALGPDHGRSLGDPPQRLAQVASSANERNLEVLSLVDVVLVVGWREDF